MPQTQITLSSTSLIQDKTTYKNRTIHRWYGDSFTDDLTFTATIEHPQTTASPFLVDVFTYGVDLKLIVKVGNYLEESRKPPTNFLTGLLRPKPSVASYSNIFPNEHSLTSFLRNVLDEISDNKIIYPAGQWKDASLFKGSKLIALTHTITAKFCGHCGFQFPRLLPFCTNCGKAYQSASALNEATPRKESLPPLIIPDSVRNQHIYIPGKTRHGKSTVIGALAFGDIRAGKGVCVIDPKGDLVTHLLSWIPDERKDDCIYIDPDNPIPIDFLDYDGEREKQTLVGELKYVITKGVSSENAPLMNSMLTDLIYTIFDANEHGMNPKATFLDIHDFLAFESRRKKILQYVTSERLQERWSEKNFPSVKERQPTLTRMNDFVNSSYLNKIFGCPEPTLTISQLMDEKKILLVNLGGVDEPTKLFGTILVAKIRQAAFRRHRQPEADRVPFHLFVDEFEFFQTSDFEQMLSFAGGYGLRLVLANQFIGQLDPNIRQSVLGNVGSFIIFAVAPHDARHFDHFLPEPAEWQKILNEHTGVKEKKIENLPRFHALVRIAGKEPFFAETPPPPPPSPYENAEYIRTRTLDRYSCKSKQQPHNPDSGKPKPEGTVLSNDAEAAGSRPARQVLRSPEQGSRSASPKSRPDPNRYPDDKPNR